MTGPAGRPHVAIAGMMGAGKSTVAEALAAALDRPHRDSDRDLERRTGRSGARIASELGVEDLHRLEAAVLLCALSDDRPSVISAAGSVVEDATCRAALAQRAVVVVLEASVELLQSRVRWGSHRRPMPREEIENLLDRRSPLLTEIADLTLDADQPLEVLTGEILAFLAEGDRPDRS